jgi:hypothetical protein
MYLHPEKQQQKQQPFYHNSNGTNAINFSHSLSSLQFHNNNNQNQNHIGIGNNSHQNRPIYQNIHFNGYQNGHVNEKPIRRPFEAELFPSQQRERARQIKGYSDTSGRQSVPVNLMAFKSPGGTLSVNL